MNQNNISQDKTTKRLFLCICILIFLFAFVFVIQKDWALIFKKDLHWYDESVNSVVSANLTRKFWPAMVRVNPLIQQQGWAENPYWQHIPPLFAYIPLPLFKIDGQVTIEIKRLAYALTILLGGFIFILSVSKFEKTIMATIAATIAAIFWIMTPFTQNLITGIDFGASDIVLAFTVSCCFGALCWYLYHPSNMRKNYSWWKLMLMGLIVTLPILTKNVLGAIPAATFFLLLLFDQKKVNVKLLASVLSFSALIFLYFGALYISSPITFKREIFVSFQHMENFEGWAKPWYFYLSDYIPRNYTRYFTPLYVGSILGGLYLLFKNCFAGKTKIILSLSIGWFIWNMVAVSLVKSKAPNFIFQSYLLSLFFAVYIPMLLFSKTQFYLGFKNAVERFNKQTPLLTHRALFFVFIILLGLSIYSCGYLLAQIPKTRAATYAYNSEHEKFYQFGEIVQKEAADTNDIFVLNSSQDNIWFRYYILFLTGSEARTFQEIRNYNIPVEILRKKYSRLYFVVDKSSRLPVVGIPHKVENIGSFQALIFDTKFLNQLGK